MYVFVLLVAFSAFLRYDEISRINTFPCTYLRVRPISTMKVVPDWSLGPVGLLKSPHSMLLRYANVAKEDTTSREFVFRSLRFIKIKSHFLRPGTKLSYTRAREVILLKLRAIGLDTSKLGLHSFRIGGASTAINNDLPDRMVKKHGRWTTDKAKDL